MSRKLWSSNSAATMACGASILKAMHRNLVRMVEMSHDAGASVLLLGVRLPANYGDRCGDRFRQVYRDVASETGAPLVDFFLEGVAETTALMQADGIHPSAAAQPRILENVWRALKPLLMKMTASSDVASHPDPPPITQKPPDGGLCVIGGSDVDARMCWISYASISSRR